MGTQQLNLFGDEVKIQAKRSKQEAFEDYDAFLAKFNTNAPKTTDECYTPQPVYEAVLEWLRGKVNIEGRPIVRPFFPGGDYKNHEYPENCVVVDNPPFSIVTEIARFYQKVGIDYFLFTPSLTMFCSLLPGECGIIIGKSIEFANSALVACGFRTSLLPGKKIMIAGSLRRAIEATKPKKPRIVYSDNVITSALLSKWTRGTDCAIYDDEIAIASALDCGVRLFGGGGI